MRAKATGIEKVVPSRADFQPSIELLPAGATGQPLTSYVSILRPPLPAPPFAAPGKSARPREFHLVLIDNGRSAMHEDAVLHEALYIRCGACLNVCTNFETVGGRETYSGGIGVPPWEAATGKLMNARFSDSARVASAAFRNVRSASTSPGSIRTCVIA